LIWGTTAFCDEFTGDFGGAFKATSIGVCRLFCRLAENWSHGILGLLQHYQGGKQTSRLRASMSEDDPLTDIVLPPVGGDLFSGGTFYCCPVDGLCRCKTP
jgi:hypothetical protein